MKPELTAYLHSPHARVAWHTVSYWPWRHLVHPIQIVRQLPGLCDAREEVPDASTHPCEEPAPRPGDLRAVPLAPPICREPGNRTYTYFLSDQTNPVHSIRMLLKVGGADPTHGPVGGIHWHMNVGNKVEYIATDEARQKIGWVRHTSQQGVVTEFRTPSFTNQVAPASIRTMDCVDCHNRPAHKLESPNNAVNLAMTLGLIDASLPYIKTNCVFVLVQDYKDEKEATNTIAADPCWEVPERNRRSARQEGRRGRAANLPRQFLP